MNRAVSDTNMNDRLDRLVSGDLEERDRGPLIAWLEEDPRRWRLCGLLFLESQTWSHALTEWPCMDRPLKPAPPLSSTKSAPSIRRRPIMHAAILAASVLLSFFLGFSIRGMHEPNQLIAHDLAAPDRSSSASINPVLAELPLQSTLRGLPKPTVQIPVIPKTATDAAQEPLPDYVRQQWERRGYQLQLERRYVFARLPGGQQVAVPIEQYSVKHVPPQIN